MKYYKLKTVMFYIFVATIMSFDLKGSENENEWNCSCCCCPDDGKKKGEKEEGEKDTKDKKKEEDKKEGEEGEGGEGENDGEGGGDEEKKDEEKKDEEKKDEEKKDEEKKDEEEEENDDDENFILGLKQCFDSVINKEKFKTYVGKKEGMKERLFIVDLNEGWNEIVFEKLKDNLSELFSYKEKWSEKKLLLNNLSLISYCLKNENDEESKILEFEMDPNSTINQVFDHFKNASTWSNDKKCLILFIKDQDSNIVSLVPIAGFFKIYKENK